MRKSAGTRHRAMPAAATTASSIAIFTNRPMPNNRPALRSRPANGIASNSKAFRNARAECSHIAGSNNRRR